MLTWEERKQLEERWFPEARTRMWARLRQTLTAAIHPAARVLDAGCGKGSWFLRSHLGQARLIAGIDVVRPPTHILDAFVQGTLETLPFPDGVFDVVVCNDVIEHLERPYESMAELARVLRPSSGRERADGGILLIKTPSLLAPSTLFTHFSPFGWHRHIKARLGVAEDDVFPTRFRCNTPRALDACLRACGLRQEWLLLVDGTFNYFAFNRPAYVLGLLYSRLMYLPLLKPFRSVMVGAYRKVVG